METTDEIDIENLSDYQIIKLWNYLAHVVYTERI
jgi:hypothetical protein